MLRDPETAPINDAERLLLRFVEKVNTRAHEIRAEDMQPLIAAGWNDQAIYDAFTVCALFNFFNRWNDAAGVTALSEEAHREGGKRMVPGYIRSA